MSSARPFAELADRYEGWFEVHEDAYRSELEAVHRILPSGGRSLEIGVGSGRFAGPLDFDIGIDPARPMLDIARERGITVVQGVAERLPFRNAAFDTVLIVTTICFVEDIPQTLAEVDRVLDPGGSLVIGYIDRESPVGQIYQEKKEENPFYREAVFVSTEEVIHALEAAGFTDFEFVQTIYRWLDEIEGLEPIEEGCGEGSFVAIKAGR